MKRYIIRAIGRLPEEWQKEAIHMYEKRLRTLGGCETVELPEGQKGSANPDISRIKNLEGETLLRGIDQDTVIIALDKGGKTMDSEKFSRFLEENDRSSITFLIGGSWGLSDECLKKTHVTLSFGPMTFPHGLARVMLAEQIYRARMIATGKEYHK